MTKSEVQEGKRVRVIEPAPKLYVGQEGEITTYHLFSGYEWWVEVKLDSGQYVDFHVSEIIRN